MRNPQSFIEGTNINMVINQQEHEENGGSLLRLYLVFYHINMFGKEETIWGAGLYPLIM